MRLTKQLATVIKEARCGDLDRARRLLVAHLNEQVDDIEAWYLLSYLVPTRHEQVRALGYLLRRDPNHERALKRLQVLQNAQDSALESFEKTLSAAPQQESNIQSASRSGSPSQKKIDRGVASNTPPTAGW